MKTKSKLYVLCISLLASAFVIEKAVSLFREPDNNIFSFFANSPYTFPSDEINIAPELVPLAETPAVLSMLMPTAPGIDVKKNSKSEIDYSNAKDGYIMIRYTEKSEKQLRILIKGPSGETYTYRLKPDGSFEVFPLSDGNGDYRIGVYENIGGNKYSVAFSTLVQIKLEDELAPFLRPNQYVNYNANSKVVKKAAELTQNTDGLLGKISEVYGYVTHNIAYDKELAATVQSDYLPDVDDVLAKGRGICFDYAAVTTAMLRSQMIPTKLVVGYTGNVYHAWINVYSEQTGWISGAIYFDGVSWKLMDPTLTANNDPDASLTEYIGNSNNYTVKYLY